MRRQLVLPKAGRRDSAFDVSGESAIQLSRAPENLYIGLEGNVRLLPEHVRFTPISARCLIGGERHAPIRRVGSFRNPVSSKFSVAACCRMLPWPPAPCGMVPPARLELATLALRMNVAAGNSGDKSIGYWTHI